MLIWKCSLSLCPDCHRALEPEAKEVPASAASCEASRTCMPLSEPARRKRLWPTLESGDERREQAIRRRIELQAIATAVTQPNSPAQGHWTDASESVTLGSADDGPASDNDSLGPAPPGLTEPEPPTASDSDVASDSASEAPSDASTETASASAAVSTATPAPATAPALTSSIITAPSATASQPRIILVIRRAVPRPVVALPSPLVRTISGLPRVHTLTVMPTTPELPTGQYDTAPIQIDDDDGDDADDEESLFTHHGDDDDDASSTTAVAGSQSADDDDDMQQSQ